MKSLFLLPNFFQQLIVEIIHSGEHFLKKGVFTKLVIGKEETFGIGELILKKMLDDLSLGMPDILYSVVSDEHFVV